MVGMASTSSSPETGKRTQTNTVAINKIPPYQHFKEFPGDMYYYFPKRDVNRMTNYKEVFDTQFEKFLIEIKERSPKKQLEFIDENIKVKWENIKDQSNKEKFSNYIRSTYKTFFGSLRNSKNEKNKFLLQCPLTDRNFNNSRMTNEGEGAHAQKKSENSHKNVLQFIWDNKIRKWFNFWKSGNQNKNKNIHLEFTLDSIKQIYNYHLITGSGIFQIHKTLHTILDQNPQLFYEYFGENISKKFELNERKITSKNKINFTKKSPEYEKFLESESKNVNGKMTPAKRSRTNGASTSSSPPPLNLSEFQEVIAFMRRLNGKSQFNNNQKKGNLQLITKIESRIILKKAYEKFVELWNTRSKIQNNNDRINFNRKVFKLIKAQANINNLIKKYNGAGVGN